MGAQTGAGDGAAAGEARIDGRHARRQRGRAAVIDALFTLLDEGEYVFRVDRVADRAGVSASSVFRYFDGLDDLRQQAIAHHFARVGHLFDVPELGEGDLDDRIGRLTAARRELYEAIAPVARLARAQSLFEVQLADTLATNRAELNAQIADHFAPELAERDRAGAADLVATIATLTSFEAWDLQLGMGRSAGEIERSWQAALHVILGPDA